MSIDFGLNNIITAVLSNKGSFIIDGKHLKSFLEENVNHNYFPKISPTT